jgi:hypothetical protein
MRAPMSLSRFFEQYARLSQGDDPRVVIEA